MLVKKFIELRDIYKGKKIVVCGSGGSLLDFKEESSEFITIGVNDVPRLFTPTYLVVTDHMNRFNKQRIDLINNCESRNLITCVKGWRHPRIVYFDLGRRGHHSLDDPSKVDHNLNSPYVAVNIAYKMGATKIGMIGVDFISGHFYNLKDGPHNLSRKHMNAIISAYGSIHKQLKDREVELFNLSTISKVTSVPYLSIEKFKEI